MDYSFTGMTLTVEIEATVWRSLQMLTSYQFRGNIDGSGDDQYGLVIPRMEKKAIALPSPILGATKLTVEFILPSRTKEEDRPWHLILLAGNKT